MIEALTVVGVVILGFVLFIAGFIGCIIYIVARMMKTIGDDSNMNNPLRLLNQATIHPEDFGRMYYLTHKQMKLLRDNGHEPDRPGWYVDGDEFADVVKSRPGPDHV